MPLGCGEWQAPVKEALTFFILVKHWGLVGVVPAHIPQLPLLLHARPLHSDVRCRIFTGTRDVGCSRDESPGMQDVS